jgi:pyruvate kinase (EC 2.7.1.40)
MRKTKIIATLGPKSIDKVKDLAKYVDVFRINFAYGNEETHKQYFDAIIDSKKNAAILVDLPGQKIRIGELKEKMFLKRGDLIVFSQTEGVPVEDTIFYSTVKEGHEIIIGDGNIKIRITKADDGRVEGYIIEGGLLTSRKGINIPRTQIPSGITENDLILLNEALKLGADFIGLSFVLSEKDVIRAKEIAKDKAWIISKIEKIQALKRLRAIIEASNGIMVARGDLGIEIGIEKVPFVQKRIVEIAKSLAKPVIVATQVLESMVNNPIPTRAETTDVVNAINEGVDAILLSDETAEGNYPVEAVRYLHRIISFAEMKVMNQKKPKLKGADDAIALATLNVAEISKAKIIVAHSRSGNSIIRVARFRPSIPILGICPSIDLAKKLNICYGVIPIVSKKKMKNINEIIMFAEKTVKRNFKYKGTIVITGGDPKLEEGRTDFIKLHNLN